MCVQSKADLDVGLDTWTEEAVLKGYKTLSYRQLLKIIRKYADGPVRSNGSHQIFKRKTDGKQFAFPVRSKDFKSGTVRKILTKDLGLDEPTAIKEVTNA
ncbi:type II toxin-antitoxin system HicA family toxin [Corynebacterium hindlerae]|uniref:type II toxin-antitoxin system HicA family toxin n=1 Tax=Corynebacterium hindlerae TaxID=699041 RepID=UPI003B84B35A